MPDQVLWRRLNQTDFKSMHGQASPDGRGGGAMHIVLGVPTSDFAVDHFLLAPGQRDITIATTPLAGLYGASKLAFLSNPDRRAGEWMIRDQFSHRHPAWTSKAGFPDTYDPANPPYVLVFRVGRRFSVRFANKEWLRGLSGYLPPGMLSANKGIGPATPGLLRAFKMQGVPLTETFRQQALGLAAPSFDPKNLKDARTKIFTSIFQRQGQQKFRRGLLRAYAQKCAITGEGAQWVLEAAHIVPYLGPKTNSLGNGLLLRADIHTLFDLGLLSIDPKHRKIQISSLLNGTGYARFADRSIREPSDAAFRPASSALEAHFGTFQP